MAELRTETLTVNMGPQHPSTHGVLRVVLRLDGERVVGSDGAHHRGDQKSRGTGPVMCSIVRA